MIVKTTSDPVATLAPFHPSIRQWFQGRYPSPTAVQVNAWPRIQTGKHLLITAPTGTGKTMTAFLWTLNRFATGDLALGATRVLYISPLKALNNDIAKNLLNPLSELREQFPDFPEVRVQTRSGDTEQQQRRRMIRNPPEILITTPESLNLMLSSASGLSMLGNIETVILDEIHAVVDSKRGVYLMTAIERLAALSGEFQRIVLSATVNPLTRVADFVAGYRLDEQKRLIPRQVGIVRTDATKDFDIRIRYPETTANRPQDEKIWPTLAADFHERINENRSTLLFVNSRTQAEQITKMINEEADDLIAYAHHGSLSRELRIEVENRLKRGELATIVATSTLEMGIDIGHLDEVILLQSPGNIASAIQRIGRAGHQVGEVSRCTLYPTHPMDFVHAAVLSKAVEDGNIEPISTIDCPLDVLAQIMISMTGIQTWDIDDLFTEIRRSTAFHNLTRGQFDLVLNMMAGRYFENRISELKPRLSLDRTENTVRTQKGALLSLYLSGGVIPDRGYFQIRMEGSGARIGDLDEEFVWEANVGNVFTFGTQHWEVKKITHNDVLVAPGKPGASNPPFWKSESLDRSLHLSERIGEFLEGAENEIDGEDYATQLHQTYPMESSACTALIEFLQRQRHHCNAPLPHRHHILVEHIDRAPGGADGQQIVFHTHWGNRVNRPLAMAMTAVWHEKYEEHITPHVDNDGVVVQLQAETDAADLLTDINPGRLEDYLRSQLETSGFFGARFRENAGTALLLSKGRFNERKPLWMSRLQSKKLLDTVQRWDDFPLLLETWRTCLRDEFDLEGLQMLLSEIASGDIRITEIRTQTPSPFAAVLAYDQLNTYVYEGDDPTAVTESRLRTDLLEELVFSEGLRPTVDAALAREFEQRRQRLVPGYAPSDPDDLVDWVSERCLLPRDEWISLIDDTELNDSHPRLCWQNSLLMTVDQRDLNTDTTALIHNLLQFHSPIAVDRFCDLYRFDEPAIRAELDRLIADQQVIVGPLLTNDPVLYVCEAGIFEALLRIGRLNRRSQLEPMPLDALPTFLFAWQTRSRDATDVLDVLHGYGAPVEAWESDLLPARIPGYRPHQLDTLFNEEDLTFVGCGEKQITLCWPDDLDLISEQPVSGSSILPDARARYDFGTLQDATDMSASELTTELWRETWSGQITNDNMTSLRKALLNDFGAPDISNTGTQRRAVRRNMRSWRQRVPFSGNWYALDYPPPPADLIDAEEVAKDRVRLLLARYGVLFRELLTRELPALQWRRLFRSLRIMELAGEVIAGHFFTEIPGPQFISRTALRYLTSAWNRGHVFWINATDPVALSGLGLRRGEVTRRHSNHLVYRGTELAMVSESLGRRLTFHIEPDDEDMHEVLAVLRHLQYRDVNPVKNLSIETINDRPARESPYLDIIGNHFDVVRDYRYVYLERSNL